MEGQKSVEREEWLWEKEAEENGVLECEERAREREVSELVE